MTTVTKPVDLNLRVLGTMVDVTAPEVVEIEIRDDGQVLWINVDGICRLRACRMKQLVVADNRLNKGSTK